MIDVKKIKVSDYNPRIMSKESKKALSKSMDEFEDISGIVVNTNTGNIVSGNHRWSMLVDKYGKKSLDLDLVASNLFSIVYIDSDNMKVDTGFFLRTVNWPLEKEKAANIAANSDLLSGEFTSSLQDLLSDIHGSISDSLFESLRFDELSIDMDDLDINLGSDDDVKDKIVKDAERKNRLLDDAKGEEIPEVKIILTQIKLSVPGDLEAEVREDLKKFLEKKYYSDDVKIL